MGGVRVEAMSKSSTKVRGRKETLVCEALECSDVVGPVGQTRTYTARAFLTTLLSVILYFLCNTLRCINYATGPVATETQARADARSYAVIIGAC